MKYFKRSIWALLIVSVFIGCGKVEKSEEKKNGMSDTDMEEVEKAIEGGERGQRSIPAGNRNAGWRKRILF